MLVVDAVVVSMDSLITALESVVNIPVSVIGSVKMNEL